MTPPPCPWRSSATGSAQLQRSAQQMQKSTVCVSCGVSAHLQVPSQCLQSREALRHETVGAVRRRRGGRRGAARQGDGENEGIRGLVGLCCTGLWEHKAHLMPGLARIWPVPVLPRRGLHVDMQLQRVVHKHVNNFIWVRRKAASEMHRPVVTMQYRPSCAPPSAGGL